MVVIRTQYLPVTACSAIIMAMYPPLALTTRSLNAQKPFMDDDLSNTIHHYNYATLTVVCTCPGRGLEQETPVNEHPYPMHILMTCTEKPYQFVINYHS
jgi:hypothetical protein